MLYIAFKKSDNTCIDKLITFFTKSQYVHCEVVTSKTKDSIYGYSSYIKKGVRSKWINIDDRWDVIPLNKTRFKNVRAQDIKDFYTKTEGKKYDYLGCLGFVFGNPDNPNRYFCSEWCAEALGLKNPSKISPAKLREIIENRENIE